MRQNYTNEIYVENFVVQLDIALLTLKHSTALKKKCFFLIGYSSSEFIVVIKINEKLLSVIKGNNLMKRNLVQKPRILNER